MSTYEGPQPAGTKAVQRGTEQHTVQNSAAYNSAVRVDSKQWTVDVLRQHTHEALALHSTLTSTTHHITVQCGWTVDG